MKKNITGKRFHRNSVLLYIAFLGLMTVTINVRAQSKTGGYGIGQTGWTTGSGSSGFIGELAGGIRHNRWGWGLASGIDNAAVTSVPLLADVRWALVPTRHTIEIFSQEGLNMVTQKSSMYDRFSNGPYWYGGLSYRIIPTKGKGGLLISAGVSYKQYKESKEYLVPNGVTVPGPNIDIVPGPWPGSPPVSSTITHKNWRGVLTIGWGW